MLAKRFVFNIVGNKTNVNKAAAEIQNVLHSLTNENADIIMENKETILDKIRMDKKYYINKYYFETDGGDLHQSAENINHLSRHIRNSSRGTIHPLVIHIDNDTNVRDFMNICSQVNCVYNLNSSIDEKKDMIDLFI